MRPFASILCAVLVGACVFAHAPASYASATHATLETPQDARLAPLATKSFSGTGIGETKAFTLEPGIYAVRYSAEGNGTVGVDGTVYDTAFSVGVTADGKRLSGPGALTPAKSAVICYRDYGGSVKGAQNIVVTKKAVCRLAVTSAGAGARWTLRVAKLGVTKAKKFSGTGCTDTKMFKLTKGKTYRFTVTVSGNAKGATDTAASNFTLWVRGKGLAGALLVNKVVKDGTFKPDKKKKASENGAYRVYTCTETGYYWLDFSYAGSAARWTVKMT
jgi:hypothetical protein